jgi:hypothetical protein
MPGPAAGIAAELGQEGKKRNSIPTLHKIRTFDTGMFFFMPDRYSALFWSWKCVKVNPEERYKRLIIYLKN